MHVDQANVYKQVHVKWLPAFPRARCLKLLHIHLHERHKSLLASLFSEDIICNCLIMQYISSDIATSGFFNMYPTPLMKKLLMQIYYKFVVFLRYNCHQFCEINVFFIRFTLLSFLVRRSIPQRCHRHDNILYLELLLSFFL